MFGLPYQCRAMIDTSTPFQRGRSSMTSCHRSIVAGTTSGGRSSVMPELEALQAFIGHLGKQWITDRCVKLSYTDLSQFEATHYSF